MLWITLGIGANPKLDNNTYRTVKKALNTSIEHSMLMYENVKNKANPFPKTTNKNGLVTSRASWWCSGFFPGTLWYLYEFSGNENVLHAAEDMTNRLSDEIFNTRDHDIGFKINCSFGNGYRLTHNEKYREGIIQAAKSLSTRFDKTVGCTRSWDRRDWGFCVIIDNMMNMELLTVASALSGERSFYEMAKSHTSKTMKNHFRPDYSSYHVIGYDSITGEAKVKITYQGYADNSSWSRGQAWGLYGYTMMYRQTGDINYLNHAIGIGKYIMNHPNMPKDKIPYWDFNDPKIPNTYRDASAAAVMASAYLELSTFVKDEKLSEDFLRLAEHQLRSLSSSRYFAKLRTNGNFILKHSTGFLKKGSEVDAPLSYADYYYVEAMVRYIKMYNNTPITDNTTFASENTDRGAWISALDRIVRPVLSNMSQGSLKQNMPVETLDDVSLRKECTYLEALGRVMTGIAPWLELGANDTPEGRLRKEYIELSCKAIKNAVDPESPDYIDFEKAKLPVNNRARRQILVDAAFLSHGLLRAPNQLWDNLNNKTKERLIKELKATRAVTPGQNNWILFSAMVECAICEFAGENEWEYSRVKYALDKFKEWYSGDGNYGDGPDYHWDYYNSFVIQPMMMTILDVVKRHNMPEADFEKIQSPRYTRYAAIQERLISPEATFPVVGRSIVYRFGAFQALSDAAYRKMLPSNVSEAQVRSALTAVIKRQLSAPNTFDNKGWLKIGFYGSQIHLGETYISTGSLYLSSAVFIALGLSPEDDFWTSKAEPWTSVKVYNGIDLKADKALKK